MTECQSQTATSRVAYLINRYPSPSHTFIRREINALEEAGWTVHRFSHRPPESGLVEPDDIREAALTEVLLTAPFTLAISALKRLLQHPIRSVNGMMVALTMAFRGDRRWLAHVAYFLQACRLVNVLKQLDCHHIHAHFGTNPTAVACIASRLANISYSATFHGPHEFDSALRLNLDLKIRHARFIVTISSKAKDELIAKFPKYAHRFVHVPCGLDDFWLQPHARVEKAETLLSIARLDPQKNLGCLLQSMQLLRHDFPNLRLLIAGDGPERQVLQRQIDSLELSTRVTLLGWQSQEALLRLLQHAKVMVLSSNDEGLPVAIMEAFAVGTTVIATNVGAVSELVQPGKTGWLVPPGDPGELATAIRSCLRASKGEIALLEENARRQLNRHSVSQSANLLGQVFTDCLSRAAQNIR